MADESRVQYKFMMPAALRRQLEESAYRARRSLSAEVVLRLEDSLRERGDVSDDPLENELHSLMRERNIADVERKELEFRIEQLDQRLQSLVHTIRDRSIDDPES